MSKLNKNIEERLYQCFKRVFEKYDGQLSVDIQESDIVSDEVASECTNEFFNEMYKKYRKENPSIPQRKESKYKIDESEIVKISAYKYFTKIKVFYFMRTGHLGVVWYDENELENSNLDEMKILKKWLNEGRVTIHNANEGA